MTWLRRVPRHVQSIHLQQCNQKEQNADQMETKRFIKHDSLIALMMFGLVTVVAGFDLAHWFCCFSYATTAATINSGAGIQGSP